MLKIFFYKKNLFIIDIQDSTPDRGDILGEVNVQWESNHLYFETSEKNKDKLRLKIKQSFIKEFNVEASDVIEVVLGEGKKKAFLKTKYQV